MKNQLPPKPSDPKPEWRESELPHTCVKCGGTIKPGFSIVRFEVYAFEGQWLTRVVSHEHDYECIITKRIRPNGSADMTYFGSFD